jgi:hypothetical protein
MGAGEDKPKTGGSWLFGSREGFPKVSPSYEHMLSEIRARLRTSTERLSLATPSFEKIYSEINGAVGSVRSLVQPRGAQDGQISPTNTR